MIKIALCDDEEIFLEETAKYCEQYFTDKGIEYEITKYSEGRKLLAAEEYDIVLLDVEMPEMNGIEIKRYIEGQRGGTRIVFISSYPENMPEAFGENVMGFLIKPLEYAEFAIKMNKILMMVMNDNRVIMYETFKDARRIRLKDIMYIKAEGKYSRIFISDDSDILVLKALNECEAELGKSFVRCHKSYIVNLSHVRLLKKEIILTNGKELPIGRSVSDVVKEAYDRYIWEEGTIWSL